MSKKNYTPKHAQPSKSSQLGRTVMTTTIVSAGALSAAATPTFAATYVAPQIPDKPGVLYTDDNHDGVADYNDKRYGIYLYNFEADADHDGLTNGEEIYGFMSPEFGYKATDFTKADTDGDGINDGDEIKNGTDPNNADNSVSPIPVIGADDADDDQDGLTNGDEKKLGTNPLSKDTDQDGISDADEVNGTANTRFNNQPTNPLSEDTDFDRILDNEELTQTKTNPANADTDGDGFGDWAEPYAGMDPLVPNVDLPDNDYDHDGLTGAEESVLGTNSALYDTDGDGVNDGDEVKNGTNPLVNEKTQPVASPSAEHTQPVASETPSPAETAEPTETPAPTASPTSSATSVAPEPSTSAAPSAESSTSTSAEPTVEASVPVATPSSVETASTSDTVATPSTNTQQYDPLIKLFVDIWDWFIGLFRW